MIAKFGVVSESNFINMSAAYTDAAGVRDDPTSATARVYRQDPTSAALIFVAVVDLARQGGQVGFWGASVDVSEYDPGLYVVLFRTVFPGGINVATDTFFLSAPDDPANYITITPGVAVDAVPGGP